MAKKIPARITVAWLRGLGACSEEIKLFKKTFPGGADFTLANLRKAEKADLNLQWLNKQLGLYDGCVCFFCFSGGGAKELWNALKPLLKQQAKATRS